MQLAATTSESHWSARIGPSAQDDWQAYLHAAYESYQAEEPDLSSAVKNTPFARTLVVAAPLIAYARRHLRRELARTIAASADAAARFNAVDLERQLHEALPRQILSMISRTLVLEMHVLKYQNRLSGDSPQARFNSFLDHLRSPQVSLALLTEYPVLARQIVVCLRNWHSASLRFAADLCRDWPRLTAVFSRLTTAGALVEIESGAGDRHRGGLSVMILRFASGLCLVYKPRSLGIDQHFQQLLEWVNGKTTGLEFRTVRVLSGPDHGWVEFVERDTNVTFAGAHAYFRRQGGYLALLYLLEATDFHYENLVAAGENPVLVDLEALFQPRLQDLNRSGASDVAGRELNYSVLRVGLLPQRLFNDEKREGLDVSGLGAQAGQTTPFDVPFWTGEGTDEMHLIRQQGTFTGSPNTLRIDGAAAVDPTDYMEDIVAGFEQVYRVLLAHREELLRPDGPIARFAGDEVRVLLRATRTYARLMQESFHPDVLRDVADREKLFGALDAQADHVPGFDQVLAAERRELWNGDIPVFTAQPGGLALHAGDGTVIDDFFAESSLELVCRQLQRMSTEDLTRQAWYIRAAMTTLARGNIESRSSAQPVQPLQNWKPVEAQPLALARAIGDRLAELAIRGERDASWIGLALVNSRTFDLSPLALDLYDGLPGVALFLAYLGDTTDDAKYTTLAREAVNSVRAQLPKARTFEKSIGAFNGWGGLVYLFTHLGALWKDRELLAEAEAIVDAIWPLIDGDRELDIIGGAAGCLVTLLQLHEVTGSRAALDAADRCGQRLVARAEAQEIGVGWMGNVPGPKPLAGFSHGASGIAWALLKLSAATGSAEYRKLAHEALAYERTLFSAEHGNWRDIRESAREREAAQPPQEGTAPTRRPKFQVAWCHGAPGVALSRMLMREQLDDAVTRAELTVALETTVRHGLEGSQCLCHGAFGNLDALLLARALPAARSEVRASESLVKRLLAEVAEHGPRCANPAGIESPGLMTGLAGIGYGLLRLAAPEKVPSILALEPPATWPMAKVVTPALSMARAKPTPRTARKSHS